MWSDTAGLGGEQVQCPVASLLSASTSLNAASYNCHFIGQSTAILLADIAISDACLMYA